MKEDRKWEKRTNARQDKQKKNTLKYSLKPMYTNNYMKYKCLATCFN